MNARRIALGATRAPGAGSVSVFLDGERLKTVSLTPTASQDATRTYREQVIPIATFDSRRAGVIKVRTTTGRPVAIEGPGISANKSHLRAQSARGGVAR